MQNTALSLASGSISLGIARNAPRNLAMKQAGYGKYPDETFPALRFRRSGIAKPPLNFDASHPTKRHSGDNGFKHPRVRLFQRRDDVWDIIT